MQVLQPVALFSCNRLQISRIINAKFYESFQEIKMQEYLSINDCDLGEFSKSLDRELQQNEVPLSHDIQKNVPIYDVSKIDFYQIPNYYVQNGQTYYIRLRVFLF